MLCENLYCLFYPRQPLISSAIQQPVLKVLNKKVLELFYEVKVELKV